MDQLCSIVNGDAKLLQGSRERGGINFQGLQMVVIVLGAFVYHIADKRRFRFEVIAMQMACLKSGVTGSDAQPLPPSREGWLRQQIPRHSA